MQYILLIAVFLALGVLTKKAADIVKNLLYIALLLLAGAFIWYILMPHFFGTKLEQTYKKELETQQQNLDNLAQEVEKSLPLNEVIKKSILQKKAVLQDQFVNIAAEQMLAIKNQYANKLSTVEVPSLPSKEEFIAMNPLEQAKIRDSVVAFFKFVPSTEVVDAPMQDIAPEGEPDVLMQGLFTDDLALENATGLVSLYALESGITMVRLEQFSITNGPDLELYLAQVDPTGENVSDTFVFVGQLKATSGDQNYVLPADIQVQLFDAIVVYSPTLDTAYAVAPLR